MRKIFVVVYHFRSDEEFVSKVGSETLSDFRGEFLHLFEHIYWVFHNIFCETQEVPIELVSKVEVNVPGVFDKL